jgi:hypothetical protein
MNFDNQTAFPAKLFRTALDEDRLAASLALRVTYESANGRFTPSAEQDWIISGAPRDTPYGQMPGDELFYRGGVDIFVLGHLRPSPGQTSTDIDIRNETGGFNCRVKVFGDRVWQRTPAGLVPSAPEPIENLSLTLANAFGGTGAWDGLDVPFAHNPKGKGFYLEEEHAVDMPLPNIEDPDNLVAKWNDHPVPVGVGICPPDFAGRAMALVDPDTQEFKFSAKFFNAAFPAMIAPPISPGDILTLRGVTSDQKISVRIPTDQFQTRLSFGDELITRAMPIDQVGIELDRGRIFVSYRYPFRYVVHRRQQRNCELRQLQG